MQPVILQISAIFLAILHQALLRLNIATLKWGMFIVVKTEILMEIVCTMYTQFMVMREIIRSTPIKHQAQ